ncbi:hypothetical protein IEQ34_005036 [Dendrobium chrysotoxum]|uniref:Uncharacterized protein n=1 Tax=Dendrobium chrysotoxum TaxID=161865 RepID=A0AAV7HBJ5_DENCH|nr:hypothetical protein IEQ34_005036 [Dendrobium chrysotoxum]
MKASGTLGPLLQHALCIWLSLPLFVNGPFALITTAISAALGTHSLLKGNSRALTTIIAIIDSTGSAGAALLLF